MTTVTSSPAASADDAWEDGAGAVTLTGNLPITAGTRWGGIRFPSVVVPTDAQSLSVQLTYYCVNTSNDDPNCNWHCQESTNAAQFTTAANNVSGRTRTAAFTADVATGVGTGARNIDITTAVQEVLTDAGAINGGLVVIADGLGSTTHQIISYDTGGNIPALTITYTTGSGSMVRQVRLASMVGGRLTS